MPDATSHCRGRLYLNGRFVGNVAIRGWDGPWGFGEFRPAPAFEAFAPLYNEWARLMHSPEIADRLTPNIAEALREVECALYAIAAKIYVEEFEAWRQVSIVTIDGPLIEWKETWSGDGNTDRNERESPKAAASQRAEKKANC